MIFLALLLAISAKPFLASAIIEACKVNQVDQTNAQKASNGNLLDPSQWSLGSQQVRQGAKVMIIRSRKNTHHAQMASESTECVSEEK